jgi:beta-glucosidase
MFSVNIKNTGNYDSDEIIQVYIGYPKAERMPVTELKAFKKINLTKGKEKTISFIIPLSELKKWEISRQQWKFYPGEYSIRIGKNANETILEKKLKIEY